MINTIPIPELVAGWLKENGYDGLCCEGCGCGNADIMPCGELSNLIACEPAFYHKQTETYEPEAAE